MKSLKMGMMTVFTILAITAFAQSETTPQSKSTKQQTTQIKYNCLMHPDITSDKPGKCSKCGMDLTQTKKEEMKMDVVKIYSCPMHPEVTSEQPGKCSKCGMNLKEVNKTSKAYACPMHADVTSDQPGKCPKCGMALKEKKAKG